MTPAPPRRPRRWWTVLVQSAICVGLAAIVAWPERHQLIFAVSARVGDPLANEATRMAYEIHMYVDPGSAVLVIGEAPEQNPHRGSRRYALDLPRDDGTTRRVTYYRDAGLHVLLGDLWE